MHFELLVLEFIKGICSREPVSNVYIRVGVVMDVWLMMIFAAVMFGFGGILCWKYYQNNAKLALKYSRYSEIFKLLRSHMVVYVTKIYNFEMESKVPSLRERRNSRKRQKETRNCLNHNISTREMWKFYHSWSVDNRWCWLRLHCLKPYTCTSHCQTHQHSVFSTCKK